MSIWLSWSWWWFIICSCKCTIYIFPKLQSLHVKIINLDGSLKLLSKQCAFDLKVKCGVRNWRDQTPHQSQKHIMIKHGSGRVQQGYRPGNFWHFPGGGVFERFDFEKTLIFASFFCSRENKRKTRSVNTSIKIGHHFHY